MTISITRLSKHAWFKIKTGGRVIHIDPGYPGNFDAQGVPLAEYEEPADLVLVTHSHKDHLQPEAFAKIRRTATIVLAPACCAEEIGTGMTLVKPGDERTELVWQIQVVNAYNTPEGHSTTKAHHAGECVGYLIDLPGLRLYHPGDTDLIPDMQDLGAVDLALLPIGGTYTMDAGEALQAVGVIKPRMVIGMHELKADPQEFKRAVEALGNVKAIVMAVGDTVEV